jgi:hypothetical protein
MWHIDANKKITKNKKQKIRPTSDGEYETPSSDDEESSGEEEYREAIWNTVGSDDEEVRVESKESEIPDISKLALSWPNRILILGPSESGKTNTLKHIVKNNGHNFSYIMFFGKNENEETWLPQKRRKKKVSKKLLQSLWDKHKKNPRLKSLFIFDDILQEDFHRDPWWASFISTCRHQNMSLIFSIQYLKSVPPVIRDNCNKILIIHANNRTTSALFELCGGSRNIWEFKAFIQDHVTFGQFVLLDTAPHATKELTVWRADKCPQFRVF